MTDTRGATTPAPPAAGAADFPRRHAATRRFSLGRPRSATVSADGGRVVFLRAAAGDDPATGLWVLDVADARERLVADPATLDAGADLTPEERVRRERSRESAEGVVAYATDRQCRVATFAVGGRPFVADLDRGTVQPLHVPQRVADPRPDPEGQRVAFVSERGLWVVERDGVEAVRIAGEDDPDVSWGLPEFIAAEEMGRSRGFWWAPDGTALAAARVDVADVVRWHLADPVDPAAPAVTFAYPATGTPNADVRLVVVPLDGSDRVTVDWDRAVFPYLADVVWSPDGPLTLVVQSRDQRTLRWLAADPATGATSLLREDHDRHWVDLVPGTPRWLPGGRLVTTVPRGDVRALAVGDALVTGEGFDVRSVVGVMDGQVVVTASTAPGEVAVWRVPTDGREPEPLSPTGGVASAAVGGDTILVSAAALDGPGTRTTVSSRGAETALRDLSEPPGLAVRVELLQLGERSSPAALVLPAAWEPSQGPLPVLLDPYGGPGHARVVAAHDAYLTSQWFAEQGFAVLVVDGRGVPGRGPAVERAIAGDLAGPVLDDQIDALLAAGRDHPALDLARVAIRGWSFGGYLAALAVLRRPDVVHAAIAGAPVTDWRLYDTHYTERYLGHPDEEPDAYRRSSLLEDAAALRRPLLLIHGLADDNVVAAHTLRLSRALLEAGRPHIVLPLSGVTHMTPQETVAENLLLLQLGFLRDALGLTAPA